MVLAELNIRHTRRHQPTRRVAIGDVYLPTSGPGYGAILLGAVIAEHLPDLDEEQRELAPRLLAAQVGGIGIAPGGNINYVTGHGVFEATHGTAPKYAGQDKVNPGSVILSGVMMFEHLGWQGAADDIVRALEATIGDKIVTYDFARLMDGATEVKTSEFAAAIVDRL